MKDVILKLIRDGYPMSTAEILHDLAVMKSQGLLPADVDVPETLAAVSTIVNAMQAAGEVQKVTGGWKLPPPQPVPEVFMGCVQ